MHDNRMFKTIDRTWNVVTGCRYECPYCCVRKNVIPRLAESKKYKGVGFLPAIHRKELLKQFKPGERIFVSFMGDLFQDCIPDEWIKEILDRITEFPETEFLLMTKNPARYGVWQSKFPSNIILGTTIETNMRTFAGYAPDRLSRFQNIYRVRWPRKFISIEPIMDFDPIVFKYWILHIHPETVEIGADNYHNHLPEPSWEKVENLMSALRESGIQVIEKKGLERIKHGRNYENNKLL